jgi:HD-like signal output (HDOD) protein
MNPRARLPRFAGHWGCNVSAATSTDTVQAAGQDSSAAFAFVRSLATELSRGSVQLPGYPAVVARIQQMLNDPNVDMGRMVNAIGSEPTIAGQIVRLANSAALNPQRIPAPDLSTAIKRVGLNSVRTATVAFAMNQLRAAPELRGLELHIESLWRRSVQVASLSQAIARRFTQLNSEAAMLAGLLQGTGRLYILSRANQHRALFSDAQAYSNIEQTWHLNIAIALLESWGIAPEIVDAVRDSEDMQRDNRGAASLSDVLMVAALLADFDGTPDLLQAQIQSTRAFQRLQLDFKTSEAFMATTAQEIASLREALSH